MKKLMGFLALIGALAIVIAVVAGLIGLISLVSKPGVPSKVILEVNLETGVLETIPDDPLGKMMNKDATVVLDVVEALQKASTDDRVEGVIARVGAAPMGLAQIQEIRDAITHFRESGKFAVAWGETYGEAGVGNGAYYLATAFDEIWMQPSGDIGLTGLIYESPFIKDTLAKLEVTPRFDHRYEYKNAMNLFTEDRFTPAHREAMARLAESQFDQIVRGIAERRGKTTDQVRALIDRGPFLGKEALDAGLVDGLAYRDEVYAKVKERADGKAKLLYLKAYLDRAGGPYEKGKTIALIYGIGGVTRGKSGFNPVTGEVTMGSDSVTAAFRAALADENVKAIVFRVDSPGGSYVASDSIWRETLRAKDKGIPVVITMGNIAGSGGYFVAMAADKIVAQPGTITGSIGVLGGKFLTRKMWEKIGVTFDGVMTSANSDMFSSHYDYSAYGWQRHEDWLDRVYQDFTGKVAEGRKLPLEKVLEVAKGRIWTGEDAKNLGLIDEVGGYDVALKLAREAAGIAPDANIKLRRFPRQKKFFESLFVKPPSNSEPKAAMEAAVGLLREIQPYGRAVKQIGLGPHPGVLSMPPIIAKPAGAE